MFAQFCQDLALQVSRLNRYFPCCSSLIVLLADNFISYTQILLVIGDSSFFSFPVIILIQCVLSIVITPALYSSVWIHLVSALTSQPHLIIQVSMDSKITLIIQQVRNPMVTIYYDINNTTTVPTSNTTSCDQRCS